VSDPSNLYAEADRLRRESARLRLESIVLYEKAAKLNRTALAVACVAVVFGVIAFVTRVGLLVGWW
jgi:hypothetical protein